MEQPENTTKAAENPLIQPEFAAILQVIEAQNAKFAALTAAMERYADGVSCLAVAVHALIDVLVVEMAAADEDEKPAGDDPYAEELL